MSLPSLVKYSSVDEYREHFKREYCQRPVATFDGIRVRFRTAQFDHCFFESSDMDGAKDVFSPPRAERIDWIRYSLQDPNADLYLGWDNKLKRPTSGRRVTLVDGDYVTVILLTGATRANFLTAYVADSQRTRERLKAMPTWQ